MAAHSPMDMYVCGRVYDTHPLGGACIEVTRVLLRWQGFTPPGQGFDFILGHEARRRGRHGCEYHAMQACHDCDEPVLLLDHAIVRPWGHDEHVSARRGPAAVGQV